MNLLNQLYEHTLGRLIDIRIRNYLLYRQTIHGDVSRVRIAPTALMNNALINVRCGAVVVEDHVFCGHNVCLLTGTHDITAPMHLRSTAIPAEGRDIVVRKGAWLASNATIVGPCVIGEMAVVGAGAVVTGDVAPYTIVGGVPARVIGQVPQASRNDERQSLAGYRNRATYPDR